MPSKTQTPLEKQRVRTGCLTCRKRRRKCDERRPQCQNCETKGLSCRYGVNVTFVDSANPGASGGPQIVSQVPAYARLKFLDGRPKSSSRPAKRTRTEATATNPLEAGASAHTAAEIIHESPPWPQENENDGLFIEEDTVPSEHRLPAGSLTESASSSKPQFMEGGQDVTDNFSPEAELLRNYRYFIAPRIDIGDPKSTFGIKLMLEARRSSYLLRAILSLTRQQRSACCNGNAQSPKGACVSGLSEVEDALRFPSNSMNRAVSVLSMLEDLIRSEPRQWRQLIISHKQKSENVPYNGFDRSMDGPIFWVYFRVGREDIAASLVTSQAPLMPTMAHIQHDTSPCSSRSSQESSENAFQSAIFLLARSLTVLFGEEQSVESPNYSDAASFASSRSQPLSMRWIGLWSENQKWYAERPVELRPVYEVRGAEVNRIDKDSQDSFPIIVFTTSLALLANAVHHITSLLLLCHRPRLVKTISGPRSTASPIWHSQSIAGIATSNDSNDHWDPLLVAGLLLAARSMSHESQQTKILETLYRAINSTGMKLKDEVEAISSNWKVAREV